MIRTDRLAGWLIVAAVLYLPLLTWIPLTTANSHMAVGETPYWLLWCLGILLVACLVGKYDGILGLIVGYAGIRAIPASWWGSCIVQIPHFNAPVQAFAVSCGPFPKGTMETALVMAGIALVIVGIQAVPTKDVRLALLAAGVIQGIYLMAQWQGMDPIWRGLGIGEMRLVGTLGQESYIGIVLGMILPLAGWWAWLSAGATFYLLSNTTGAVAGFMGLARRYGVSWGYLGAAGLAGLTYLSWNPPVSLQVRMLVWQSGMKDQTWWTWLIGHGWGGWVARMPSVHPQAGVGELFLQAHNEPIQAYYDGGMVFVLLTAWWIYAHRQAWIGMWGGAAVAVMVGSLGMFTFHAAYPALVGSVILGAAIRAQQEESAS